MGVTGAAGYLGRTLCRTLVAHPWVELVVGLDIKPWPDASELRDGSFEFYRVDVNSPDQADRLVGLDALCHLAFVIDSDRSDDLAHRVNVEGSWSLMDAAIRCGLRRVVLASSVSAYGALPDNPPRLTEDHPLRAGSTFRYAFHKVLVEKILDRFERLYPDLSVVRLRIATVLGPPPRPGAATDVLSAPVLALPRSFQTQFVHADDVATAFLAALHENASGAYNVAAEPPLSGREIAVVTGQRYLPLPGALLGLASNLLQMLPVRDPGRLDFLNNPILVDCTRIETELDWHPRHDTFACLRALFD